MTYIENIFLCMVSPLLVAALCMGRRQLRFFLFCIAGMGMCLLSAYINTFLAAVCQADALAATAEIAPVVEEMMKLLPLVFYLLVFEPESERIKPAAITLALSFATFENVCYLIQNGADRFSFIFFRGFGTGAMHVLCGLIVGGGLAYTWWRTWLKIAGTCGLLGAVITLHAIYNLLIVHGGANKGKKLMIRVATAVALLALGLVSKTNLGETHWATIVVFIAAYLVAGYDVLWRAICNIRHGEVFDENFLMTVASVGAMCVAEYAEGVAVMVLYQIGEYFQDKAVDKSRESITKLMDIRPDYANLVDGNDSRRVSPEQVRVGDIILVKPGEKIPLDGVVIEGNSSLNTTALTGESLPRDVKEGDQVLSGCVNLSGVMKVKVTVGYGESTVAKILALVESSGDAKAKTERFITKFSRIYTPAVCFFALALAIIPSLFDGNWTNWIYTALTFLVISCPCALVISVPLTFFSGIGGASKKGILIKGATYLETLAGLDTVVFDKTGTLTKGTFSVTGVHPAKSVTKDELLDAAAHAEAFSDHPIAISIKEALGRAVDMNRVSDASEAAGHGVQAKVDGQQVYAGNARLMESIGVKAAEPAEIGTVVHVARGGQYLGALVISDVIKENSASAMEALKSAGVKRLVMLTGDRQEVAADIAKKVGLTDYRAELLPEDKVSALEGLLGNGHTVAFTGDGINDAPVLRRADIGIAMGGVGADAAIEAADIVLMDDDPAKIAQGVRHARRTMRIVHQNIIFALAVKLLVMVLGICGFANMWLAVFADVGVAMLAILNAMRAMKMK